MKKIFFLSVIFVLLASCTPATGLPTAEPTKDSTATPIQTIQTSPAPTLQATSTAEPMMFKVAEFGRGYIFDHALSPDGKTMAIASSSGLYLYDLQTQEIVKYIKSEKEDIDKVIFSSNGEYLAYHGSKIRILSLESGEIALETDQVYRTNFIGFNSDDRFLAFTPLKMGVRGGFCISTIEVWDIKNRKKIFFHDPPEDYSYDDNLPCPTLSKVAFNQNNAIIFAGYGGGIVAWELSTGKQLFYTPAYSGSVTDILYDSGSDVVVTGDSGGAIRYWNARTGEKIKTLGVTSTGITSIKLSNDKTQLLVETSEQSVSLVNYKTGKLLGNTKNGANDKEYTGMAEKLYNDGFFALNDFEFDFGEYTRYKKIAYNGDGSKIATDCTIIDAHDGKTTLILPSCDWGYRYGDIAYSKTGKYIADGDNWGGLKLWNAMSGELIIDEQDLGYINTLAFSESENLLAVGTDYVSLWDIEKRRLIKNFYPGTGRVEYVGFKENDQTLIAVTVPDYLISTFDIKTGRLLSFIRSPLPEVIYPYGVYPYGSVHFSGNKMIAEGIVWEITGNSAKVLLSGTFEYDQLPAVTPDERVLVVQNYQGLNFWDIKAKKIIYTFDAAYMDINPIFSPDGNHIAFIAPGGTIQIWDVSHIVEQTSP